LLAVEVVVAQIMAAVAALEDLLIQLPLQVHQLFQ
jgi:hypothetical protein